MTDDPGPHWTANTRLRNSLRRISNRVYGDGEGGKSEGGKAAGCAEFINRHLNAIENDEAPPGLRNPYTPFLEQLKERYPEVWEGGGEEAWNRFREAGRKLDE